MEWFRYKQSHSGGKFIFTGLSAYVVWIEANSDKEADEIAEDKTDIYFNGVYRGRDCACCGDRWCSAWIGEEKLPTVSEYDLRWGDSTDNIILLVPYGKDPIAYTKQRCKELLGSLESSLLPLDRSHTC